MILSRTFVAIVGTLATVVPSLGFTPGFPYGKQAVRGVNLGGWLVLEPWITPSLFDNTGDTRIVDEWTFGQYQDKSKASATLKKHWDTWITESDFTAIAAAGLNHVRIPIGYWAFDVGSGEPFITGQLPYLNKAVAWATKYNIKVIVDLHGVPGSQNGFDNSGRRVSTPAWHSNKTNVARSNAIIKTIANLYKDNVNNVPVIAPLNEPAGFKSADLLKVTKQFWLDSWGNIRYPYGSNKQSNTVELIHDAFQPLTYWKDWQTYPNYNGVAMDKHIYQMFSQDQVSRSNAEHISAACAYSTELADFDLWLIIGEWTPAATDCTKYLNGRGVGARYDGTRGGSTKVGSCTGLTGNRASFSSDYKTFLRQYWEAQTLTYEKYAQGWVQWTWKAENSDDWSYQAGLAGGWIPQDPTNRAYPNICG